MNVLIIGSEGFIGSNLCNFYGKKEVNVYGVDILEAPSGKQYTYVKTSRLSSYWEDIFLMADFDICINAAGSGNVSYSVGHPVIDFEANTLDVIRILDSLRMYQPECKYLHISSAAVYGNPVELPVKESEMLNPISPYGYHKLMSEIICKEYNQIYGILVAIIRPFSIYGPGLRKQLLWDLCTKLSQDETVTLFGTGNESRDFIHISDFAEIIGLICEKGSFKCDVYNIGSGQETTVQALALVFEKYFEKKVNFNGESKAGDPKNWKADIERIKSLGFQPNAILEEKVIEYIHWFNQSRGII